MIPSNQNLVVHYELSFYLMADKNNIQKISYSEKEYIKKVGISNIFDIAQTHFSPKSISPYTLEMLEKLARSIIKSVGQKAKLNCEIAGRGQSNFLDVFSAMEELGIDSELLLQYIEKTTSAFSASIGTANQTVELEMIKNDKIRQEELKISPGFFADTSDRLELEIIDESDEEDDDEKVGYWD